VFVGNVHPSNRRGPDSSFSKTHLCDNLRSPAQLGNATSFTEWSPVYNIRDVAQDLSYSATTLAFQGLPGMIRVRLSDRVWTVAKLDFTYSGVVARDDVFALRKDASGFSQVVRIEENGDITPFVTTPGVVHEGLTFDGTHLYWQQFSGNPNPQAQQPHTEIWRTLYSPNWAQMQQTKTRILSLDAPYGPGVSSVASGYYLAAVQSRTLLVRLSDFAYKEWTLTPTTQTAYPFYADATHIWFYQTAPEPSMVHYGKVTMDW
jgi:hypothetical protein